MEDILLDEEDVSSIGYHLSEILKKYRLDEDEEKSFNKLEKDDLLNGEIISGMASDLAKNSITESDASLFLQKNLGIPEETAKNIVNDIKNIIVPPLKEILNKRYDPPQQNASNIIKNEELISPIIKSPISTEETLRNNITPGEKGIEPMTISEKPKRITKKTITNTDKEPKEKAVQQTRQDNYREPIE